MGWKEMTQPVSLEEYTGEIPRPAPRPAQPADSWVQLRQQPGANIGEPGVGYYTYGTDDTDRPGTGANGQWGERRTMDVIQSVADKLAMGNQSTPFGVGNISLAGGGFFKGHSKHRDGLGIDVRPARTDLAAAPTNYRNPEYDRAATRRLIAAFQDSGQAKTVLFNDPELINDPDFKGFVKWTDGHDDHFHVQLK